ncbi:hypothetical protein OIDMADRAFT_105569 [Oidiodendron maius Zn]|uniref:Ribosomal protein s17 n=1 Tax=Oidiodendron maius (strain Zn) TaxID=913774 RepID=A0A0C3D8D2_OIDMZ|nr:hypothetical protein OIDMADRAFT_105569 [Oidiodendron maius Zn]
MIFTKLACAVALTSAIAYASPANNGGNAAASAAGGSGGTTLLASAIQKGSFNDGSDEIGANEVGQALSATSQNNFINNCAGKTLTNGLQITTGSCNGIPMGDIPAKTAMVSSIIINPQTGQQVPSDTTFNITVQMANIVAGSFTNADATYYAAPQALSGGKVVGHTHVTVQDLGNSLNPTQALDATQFAFFKGINDAGNGQGLLSAVVTGGLPAGNYRVCTMAAASNHQPVLMPVAQRGTPDDCTKFVVTGNGNTPNAAANDGSGGLAAAALAASAVAAGPDVAESSAPAAASATAAAAAAGSSTGKAGSGTGKAGSGTGKAAGSGTAKAAGSGTAKAAGSGASSAASGASNAASGAGNAASVASSNTTSTAAGSSSSQKAATGSGSTAAKSGQGKGGKGGKFQKVRRDFIA